VQEQPGRGPALEQELVAGQALVIQVLSTVALAALKEPAILAEGQAAQIGHPERRTNGQQACRLTQP
jgi:hypothetical protein